MPWDPFHSSTNKCENIALLTFLFTNIIHLQMNEINVFSVLKVVCEMMCDFIVIDDDRMSNIVLLSDDKLDVDEARRTVMSPAAGVVSMFIGLFVCILSLLSVFNYSGHSAAVTVLWTKLLVYNMM